MSFISNVISTTYRAVGAQAVIQQSRMMAQGMGNLYNNIQKSSQQSGILNNQWRAIGTTMRYALAGQAVFGVTRMIGQLKDVQQQLGLIQAVGSKPGGGLGGTPFSTKEVDALGRALQGTAMDTLTPINEINDATINFLSTVQNVKQSDIPNIITSIGQAAKLTQTPIEDLTQAATTMNIAFGRQNNAKNIAQFNREWFAVIQQAPGGIRAAPELAKQLPNVSTVFQQGLSPNVSPARAQSQMMSLVLASTRFGATPATAMRGLAYFIQSLETPASAKAREALTGIGITPQTVRKRGIYATTIDFLKHIRGRVSPENLKRIQAIPEDQLQEGQNLPGVAPNQMNFLRTSLGRIHAVRAAIVLASQLSPRGGIPSLQQQLNLVQGAQDDQLRGAAEMARAWKNFRDRSKLQEAAIAINTMSLQVAQTFEPVLNFAASHVLTPVAKTAHRHPQATRDIAIAGAAALGFAGLRRFVRGVGGFAWGGIGQAQAVKAVSNVGGPIGSSPLNPLYVTVVTTLSNPGGGLGPGTPTGPRIPPIIQTGEKTAEETAKKTGRFARLGTFLRRGVPLVAARAALPVGVALAANEAIRAATGTDVIAQGISTHLGFRDDAQQKKAHMRELEEANRLWGRTFGGRVTGIGYPDDQRLHGPNQELTLNINVKHPDGSVTKETVHITPTQWKNNSFPTRAGNAQARR